MKKTAILSVLLAGAISATGDILFLSGPGSTIRISTDGGVTWSNLVNISGSNFRGLAVQWEPSARVLFAFNLINTSNNRPIVAINLDDGLILDTTYTTDGGSFNARPIGYYNGYVYVNSGGNGIEDQSVGWNGTAFAATNTGTALDSNFQANDMIFYNSGGIDYQFVNGTSASNLRRRVVVGNGTLSSQAIITMNHGSVSTTNRDLAITASGRFLTLNSDGIWISAQNSALNTAVTMTRIYDFSSNTFENPSDGDPGLLAQEMHLIENSRLYIAANQNIYRFSFDDDAGTVTFLGANAHGLNTASLHLVPEPSSALLFAMALTAVVAVRRRFITTSS